MTDKDLKKCFGYYKNMVAQLEIWRKYAEYKGAKTVMPEKQQMIAKRLEIMDTCLNALNEWEYFLICTHVIEHNTWEETSKQVEEKWGHWNSRSDRTLKRIQKSALLKMLDIVNKSGADELFK